jgi:hypothetical protein
VVIVQMTVMGNVSTLVLARLVNIVTYIITMEDTAKESAVLAGSPHQRSRDSLQTHNQDIMGTKPEMLCTATAAPNPSTQEECRVTHSLRISC